MLIEEAREAQRNHAPVRLVGDLYFIKGFKEKSGVDRGPVAILIKAFHQKYARASLFDAVIRKRVETIL